MIGETRSEPVIVRGNPLVAQSDRRGLDFRALGLLGAGEAHRTGHPGAEVRTADCGGDREHALR